MSRAFVFEPDGAASFHKAYVMLTCIINSGHFKYIFQPALRKKEIIRLSQDCSDKSSKFTTFNFLSDDLCFHVVDFTPKNSFQRNDSLNSK